MLNFERKGIALSLIKVDDDFDNKKNQLIYFSNDEDDDTIRHPYTEINIDKKNEKLYYIPNVKTERTIVYVAGKSGSGKSYWSKDYINTYHILYPKNPVYVFSYLKDDPTLDVMKFIKRIKIHDPDFIDSEFEIDDFKDSLTLFDDCDCIKDKKLRKKIDDILTKILQVGRHCNVSCLYLSHTICGGHETKLQLNESHAIVFFPNGVGQRTMKYLLENYLGFSKNQIKKVKTLKTRSVCIVKSCPTVVISDKKIYVVDNDEE